MDLAREVILRRRFSINHADPFKQNRWAVSRLLFFDTSRE